MKAKDLEMRRLFWIIWVCPDVVTEVLVGGGKKVKGGRRQWVGGNRDWCDEAMSQGMLAASRRWKRQGWILSWRLQKESALLRPWFYLHKIRPLTSGTVRDYIYIVLGYSIFGNLLRQQRKPIHQGDTCRQCEEPTTFVKQEAVAFCTFFSLLLTVCREQHPGARELLRGVQLWTSSTQTGGSQHSCKWKGALIDEERG